MYRDKSLRNVSTYKLIRFFIVVEIEKEEKDKEKANKTARVVNFQAGDSENSQFTAKVRRTKGAAERSRRWEPREVKLT